jgi:hypothetical protein
LHLKASDSLIHQIGLFHALISVSAVGAASHRARLVTAPCTGAIERPLVVHVLIAGD